MIHSAASVLSAETIEEAGLLTQQESKTDAVNPSLIITTYNWPQALRLSVESVFSQTVLPKEIIIADDGSKEDTRETIEHLRQKSPIPIIHVWQPDEGFQAAKIRNRGIAAASSEYIVFVDGDNILERHFIEDHIFYAQIGRCVCGTRVKFTSPATNKILTTGSFVKPFFLSPKIVFGYNLYAIRNRWLCNRTIREIANYQPRVRARSCNMAFWKSDAVSINGFDEKYTTWGLEDYDFALRLRHAGIALKFIQYAALQYHLFHPKRSKTAIVNHSQFQSCIEMRRIRAEKGLDQYL
ncbi:MAG: glycosyltransferase family 2 protein [Thermoguttaceae bacterium]|nr:glycosyltransferase family 2 protein [Thermoguttaceae bacterium]